MVYEKGEDMYS